MQTKTLASLGLRLSRQIQPSQHAHHTDIDARSVLLAGDLRTEGLEIQLADQPPTARSEMLFPLPSPTQRPRSSPKAQSYRPGSQLVAANTRAPGWAVPAGRTLSSLGWRCPCCLCWCRWWWCCCFCCWCCMCCCGRRQLLQRQCHACWQQPRAMQLDPTAAGVIPCCCCVLVLIHFEKGV